MLAVVRWRGCHCVLTLVSGWQSFNVLGSYLSPEVDDTPEQGWEEITDAALTSMLRCAQRSIADAVASLVIGLHPHRSG